MNWRNQQRPIEVRGRSCSREKRLTYLDLVNLQDVRKGFVELRDGLKDIKSQLDEHFSDVDINDTFISQMWAFVGKASGRLDDLQDDLNTADTTFKQAIGYYGEEERAMTSSEFYGIFKTFVTSYRVSCRVVL